MSTQTTPGRRQALSRSAKLRGLTGRHGFALAVFGAGLFAVSVSAVGADLGTGYSTAMTDPSQPAPPGRRALRAHLYDLPDAEPGLAAQHARIIDQLYEELMRRPGCSSAPKYGSDGGC
jgi:hypothetical protein